MSSAGGGHFWHSLTPKSRLVCEAKRVVGDAHHVDTDILDVVLVVVQADDAGDAREDAHQRQVSVE